MHLVLSILLILANSSFSKKNYFEIIRSQNQEKIELLAGKLKKLPKSDDKNAYLGALLMKCADFQKTPKEKIEKFKAGKSMLEHEINENPTQVEYRFLRLMIQEHAPKFLKYHANIQSDVAFIKKYQNKLPKDLQLALKDYALNSENL